jgi:hypothetical protein
MAENNNFEDDGHALVTGMVMGAAMRHGIELEPVIDADQNYTTRFRLRDDAFDQMGVKIFIVVEPPVPLDRADGS